MRTKLGVLCLMPWVAVAASGNVEITERNGVRTIKSNGIPNHAIGSFPNQHNPNRISEQSYVFTVPLEPKIASSVTPMEGHIFGIALNGIPFDPGTAEFYNNDPNSGWRYEAQSSKMNLGLDHQKAHVQPNGAYHYHGLPSSLTRTASDGHPHLIGYAADGFPIYPLQGYVKPTDSSSGTKKLFSSYRLKRGTRPDGPGGRYDGSFVQDYEFVQGMGDLDACNGRYGITPEYPNGTYYYVITQDFPFVPRCFTGIPDQSFYRQRPGGPNRLGQPARAPSAQNPFSQPVPNRNAPPVQSQEPSQRAEPRYYQSPSQREQMQKNQESLDQGLQQRRLRPAPPPPDSVQPDSNRPMPPHPPRGQGPRGGHPPPPGMGQSMPPPPDEQGPWR